MMFPVECAAGMEADDTGTVCEPCEIGSYKESSGLNSCASCRITETTADVGANSPSLCIGKSVSNKHDMFAFNPDLRAAPGAQVYLISIDELSISQICRMVYLSVWCNIPLAKTSSPTAPVL